MHGHGYGYVPPPPKRSRTVVLFLLRVVFVAVPIVSIGFLAWVATLRAAIVTRKRREWVVFVGSLAVMGVSFSLLSTDHTDDFSSPKGSAGMVILLLNAVACVAYFLWADIRHHHRAHLASYAVFPGSGVNYAPPQPFSPYATTHPQAPVVSPMPAPAPPAPRTPPPVPSALPPQRPAPARIDQVRAELDELSDYLRKHDGHEGGR
ncbi:hypothetical protein [Streptomyces sp. NPDC005573]|uniref:hypothetical protein n=1 Tax=unclassified Streptomyces TaxID=2593676 RepID=UPI0033AFE4E7